MLQGGVRIVRIQLRKNANIYLSLSAVLVRVPDESQGGFKIIHRIILLVIFIMVHR